MFSSSRAFNRSNQFGSATGWIGITPITRCRMRTITPSGNSSRSATSADTSITDGTRCPGARAAARASRSTKYQAKSGPKLRTLLLLSGSLCAGATNEYLLAWTTTPWTLTSNVASAVHPELTYLKVRQGDDIYYLIKERAGSRDVGSRPCRSARRDQGRADGGLDI